MLKFFEVNVSYTNKFLKNIKIRKIQIEMGANNTTHT